MFSFWKRIITQIIINQNDMIFYLEGYIFLFHNCLLYFYIVIENKILEVEFRFEDIKELPLLITL